MRIWTLFGGNSKPITFMCFCIALVADRMMRCACMQEIYWTPTKMIWKWTKSIDDYIWLIAKLSVLCVLIVLIFAESFCKHSRFWWECKQVENNHIILTNVEYEYSTTTSFVCKNNHRIMKKKTTARIKYTHRPRTVDAKIPNILYTLLLLFNP